MGVLSNPRWEVVAQELVKGRTATCAIREAGYSDPRNSTRITKHPKVVARVSELFADMYDEK